MRKVSRVALRRGIIKTYKKKLKEKEQCYPAYGTGFTRVCMGKVSRVCMGKVSRVTLHRGINKTYKKNLQNRKNVIVYMGKVER